MINILKKYWLLLLIVLIAINFLGFQLIKESIGISDSLEHAESDVMIKNLKHKDLIYTIFVDFALILDFALFLFLMYNGIRKALKIDLISSKK